MLFLSCSPPKNINKMFRYFHFSEFGYKWGVPSFLRERGACTGFSLCLVWLLGSATLCSESGFAAIEHVGPWASHHAFPSLICQSLLEYLLALSVCAWGVKSLWNLSLLIKWVGWVKKGKRRHAACILWVLGTLTHVLIDFTLPVTLGLGGINLSLQMWISRLKEIQWLIQDHHLVNVKTGI